MIELSLIIISWFCKFRNCFTEAPQTEIRRWRCVVMYSYTKVTSTGTHRLYNSDAERRWGGRNCLWAARERRSFKWVCLESVGRPLGRLSIIIKVHTEGYEPSDPNPQYLKSKTQRIVSCCPFQVESILTSAGRVWSTSGRTGLDPPHAIDAQRSWRHMLGMFEHADPHFFWMTISV